MPAIVHTPRPSQTYTSVYDSATANDFNGTKTLAQIPITATDSVAILGGKLQMGPTNNPSGYAHNRATFAPSFKYGRIIAEFTVPPAGTQCGVFVGQGGGFDYFTYPAGGIYANLFGAAGPDVNRNLNQSGANVPAGNLCRLTLDILPDIGNTRQLILNTEDLTLVTSTKTLLYADCTVSNLAGTFGVWNTSPAPQTAGAAFTRIAIFSADGAADIPAIAGMLVAPMGDSITHGDGTYPPSLYDMTAAGDKSYPSQLAQLLDGTHTAFNRGHSGFTAPLLSTWFPQDVQNLKSPNYTAQVAPILIGANDIGGTADTAAVIYQRIVDLHTQVKTAGFKTIAIAPYRAVYGNVVTRSNADYITAVDAIDAQIAANWQTFADGYITLSDNAQFADPNTNTLLGDKLHLNEAGAAYLAGRVNTALSALVATPPADTNPYDSPPSNEVMVTPGYVPLAPVITSFSGLSTFPNAQVKLTWSAGNWGDIEVQRLTVGATGAAGVFATIATLNPVTPGDRTTVPLTFTDTAVVFGVPYKYRLIAQGTA